MLATQFPSTWECKFIRWILIQSVLYVLTLIEVTADDGHKKHMLKMSFFQEVVLALICRNFWNVLPTKKCSLVQFPTQRAL